MKLSTLLARILTDVKLRQENPTLSVCDLLGLIGPESGIRCAKPGWYEHFVDAREACTQTGSGVYPVLGPQGKSGRALDWNRASEQGTMWLGTYGVNRRKLVRDCLRWAKGRGL